MSRLVMLIAATFLAITTSFAGSLTFKANPPKHYVVQPGDTLWSIAQKYLKNPWHWRELITDNGQIENPNKIYPGDVLILSQSNGRYHLHHQAKRTVKLSPRVRNAPAIAPIPPIPLHLIRPFLTASLVVDAPTLDHAPYIVGYAGKRIAGASGVTAYVQGLENLKQRHYGVYRDHGIYSDPKTGEILGIAAFHLGKAEITEFNHPGEPATAILSDTRQEVHRGDRLLPLNKTELAPYFCPKLPNCEIHAQIIGLFGGINKVALNQVVVINAGAHEGVELGDVLAVFQPLREVADPIYKDKILTLPPRMVGEVMIFRRFARVSYALVVHATEAIHKFDFVGNPSA